MNVSQIEIALSQKISASSTNFDLLAAAKALQLLKTNGVFVVSSYGGLPAAASNEGKIYFIENIETVVWSNGTDWLRLLDKNTIQFQLWNWGKNTNGRLGDGTVVNRCSPVREFCSALDWSDISLGYNHAAAAKTTGEIWTWGANSAGQLGTGTTVTVCSPVREVSSSTDWCQVSASSSLTLGLKTSGQIWGWGCNRCGAIGNGTTVNTCSPVREFCSATNWCQVSASNAFSVAIKTTGQLWSWGANGCGQLGDGTLFTTRCSPVREFCSATDWCQVSTGFCHTAAVKTSGQLWVWGYNTCGRLGDGTTVLKNSPVREISSSTDWQQVSSAWRHTTAIKTSGQLWSWGFNCCGRLGDGTTTDRCSPVREFCSATDWCQVTSKGSYHTAAIKTSGQLWTWGYNRCGQLGDGTVTSSCSPVREFCSATDWNFVSAGYSQTAAIKLI